MTPVIWAILTAAFLLYFVVRAFQIAQPRRGTLEWIANAAKPTKLEPPENKSAFTLKDYIAVIVITAVYAVAAFFYLGDNTAPQSFYRFSDENPTINISLNQTEKITKVAYYTGLEHGGGYKLEFSVDGTNWTDAGTMTQKHGELFRWRQAELTETEQSAAFVRITVQPDDNGRIKRQELGELAFYSGDRRISESGIHTDDVEAAALFDENYVIPDPPVATILNGSHFDEIYHARTAYEHILGRHPYEITHPPLGKLFIGIGIRIFGMTPFGWRFIGTLFGVFMVPVFYIIARRMFDSSVAAVCSTLFFTFDFMHFVQTRISTIDVYGVFFILLMYMFMIYYFTGGVERPFKKTMLPLLLCGLSFGLGIASKWISFYAAIGLAVLLLIYLIKRYIHSWEHLKEDETWADQNEGGFWPFFGKTALWCVLCFVIIPAVIYTLSYIPYATAEGGELTFARLIDEMWRNQPYMLKYHGATTTPHVYESDWYQWIVNQRPILYWMSVPSEGMFSRVAAWLNPVVCWGGLMSLVFCVWHYEKEHRWQPLVIVVGYLSQIVPWFFIFRTTFAYHYFPSMVFLALALGFVIQVYRERAPKSKLPIIVTAFSVLLFAVFYPALTGMAYPEWYSSFVLRWLNTWPV